MMIFAFQNQMRYNRELSILCFFNVGIETDAQSVLGLCRGNICHVNRKEYNSSKIMRTCMLLCAFVVRIYMFSYI